MIKLKDRETHPHTMFRFALIAGMATMILATLFLVSCVDYGDMVEDMEGMTEAGFTINPGDHPIVPIMLGDARVAVEMAEKMLDRGIYMIAFSYPVVPKDKARIRVQISSALSLEDLDKAIVAFQEVGRELKTV